MKLNYREIDEIENIQEYLNYLNYQYEIMMKVPLCSVENYTDIWDLPAIKEWREKSFQYHKHAVLSLRHASDDFIWFRQMALYNQNNIDVMGHDANEALKQKDLRWAKEVVTRALYQIVVLNDFYRDMLRGQREYYREADYRRYLRGEVKSFGFTKKEQMLNYSIDAIEKELKTQPERYARYLSVLKQIRDLTEYENENKE